MPEENRVFDVSKPGHSSPHPAGKPVIVGHHPAMADPMVRDSQERPAKAIKVTDAAEESPALPVPEAVAASDLTELNITEPAPAEHPADEPAAPPEPVLPPESEAPAAAEPEAIPDAPADLAETSAVEPEIPTAEPEISADEPAAAGDEAQSPAVSAEQSLPVAAAVDHVQELHVSGPKRRRNPLLLIFLLLLAALVAVYLLVDSGVIKTSINLPLHVFKQKTTPAPAAASANNTPAPSLSQNNQPAVPAGFTEYKIASTTITFAAPTTWGTPSSILEKGYTARSASSQPDTPYAYIVSFPGNKDIQMAATSSKALPPARQALYYDFLQWCTGTNDGKYYLSVLQYTTANKVDTPGTVTCSQGPLTGVTKLDAMTIVQTGVKNTDGKSIGDIYVLNLNNQTIPVLRIKDAAGTNGNNIKQILATVQEQTSTANSGSGSADDTASP